MHIHKPKGSIRPEVYLIPDAENEVWRYYVTSDDEHLHSDGQLRWVRPESLLAHRNYSGESSLSYRLLEGWKWKVERGQTGVDLIDNLQVSEEEELVVIASREDWQVGIRQVFPKGPYCHFAQIVTRKKGEPHVLISPRGPHGSLLRTHAQGIHDKPTRIPDRISKLAWSLDLIVSGHAKKIEAPSKTKDSKDIQKWKKYVDLLIESSDDAFWKIKAVQDDSLSDSYFGSDEFAGEFTKAVAESFLDEVPANLYAAIGYDQGKEVGLQETKSLKDSLVLGEIVGPQKACEILGIGRDRLQDLAAAGKLGVKIESRYLFTAKELRAFKELDQDASRRAKK